LVTLEQWIPESVFRAKPDVVEYSVRDNEGNIVKWKKSVYLDDPFNCDEKRRSKGLDELITPIRVDMAETQESFNNTFRPRVIRLDPSDYHSNLYRPHKSSASILITCLCRRGRYAPEPGFRSRY
jgi:hypothetical protein